MSDVQSHSGYGEFVADVKAHPAAAVAMLLALVGTIGGVIMSGVQGQPWGPTVLAGSFALVSIGFVSYQQKDSDRTARILDRIEKQLDSKLDDTPQTVTVEMPTEIVEALADATKSLRAAEAALVARDSERLTVAERLHVLRTGHWPRTE